MFLSSSLDISALTMVPVSMGSLRLLVLSKTIRAPVLDSDMLAQASTVWLITASIVAGSVGAPKK